MDYLRDIGLITLSIVLGMTGLPAVAQSSSEEVVIEEVIVTASRREEAVQDVPASITSLETDAFLAGGLKSLRDLEGFVPGLTLVNGGSPVDNNVSLRGIIGAGTATVATYVDDIPYGSATPYAGGARLSLDQVLGDIQRMEVIRGPQGTLYGASSLGGLLKYVTQDPSLSEFSGSITGDFSETEDGGSNQTYRVYVTAPIAEDRVGFSASVFSDSFDGFVDDPIRGVDDIDAYDMSGGDIKLLFNVTDRLSAKLLAMYQEADFDDTSLMLVNGNNDPVVDDRETTNFADTERDFKFQLYAITVDYDFDFSTFTSVTSFQSYENDTLGDATATFGASLDIGFGLPLGTTTATVGEILDTDRFTQEFRLTSSNNKNVEWLVGLYYTDEDAENDQPITIGGPLAFLGGDIAAPSSYEEIALFGNVTFYLNEDLDITLGGRFSQNDVEVEISSMSALVGSFPSQSTDEDVQTYLATLRYRPNGSTSLYARVASGYRPNGANAVPVDPSTGTPLGPTSFDPDEMWSYEAGIKGSLGGSFDYELAVFYMDWEDIQVRAVVNGVGAIANAPSAKSQGIEGVFTYKPTEAFTIAGTFSFFDAELTDDAPLPGFGGLDGDSIPQVADQTLSLSATYDFAIGGRPAYLNGSVRHIGEKDTAFTGPLSGVANFEMDSYTLADISAGITFDALEVGLYVTNLFDEDEYQTGTAGSGLPGSEVAFYVPMRPRTIGLRLGLSF